MCHVNNSVGNGGVDTGRLPQAGVDDRPMLFVETDLPLNKTTQQTDTLSNGVSLTAGIHRMTAAVSNALQ